MPRRKRSYADRDLKLLWGLAAARCSKPECRIPLVAEGTATDEHAVVGEIAHIVALNEGPRSDPSFPVSRRNRYENLLLLCPNHHTLVDKQGSTFTTADLRKWKEDHEAWVLARLKEEIPQVSFAELEVTTHALLNAESHPSSDFAVTDPAEKMRRNNLTNRIRLELTLGLSKAREVEDYIVHVGHLDPEFPERLKAGFVTEYRKLLVRGISGDALFESLASFAANGRTDFRFRAAGVIVLAYLFEKCEVFEH